MTTRIMNIYSFSAGKTSYRRFTSSACQTRFKAALYLLVVGLTAPLGVMAQSELKLGEEPVTQPSNTVIDLGPAKKDTAPTKPATQTPAQKPRSANPSLTQSGSSQAGKDGAPIITRHGDWEVACAQSGSPCIMAQIGNDKNDTPILEMSIRKLPQPQSVQGVEVVAVTDIITPLAVVLTAGLAMRIDTAEEQVAPFQICTAQGCLVREPLTQEAVNRFKKGSKAKLTVVSAEQGPVDVSVSLIGFTKAYSALR